MTAVAFRDVPGTSGLLVGVAWICVPLPWRRLPLPFPGQGCSNHLLSGTIFLFVFFGDSTQDEQGSPYFYQGY